MFTECRALFSKQYRQNVTESELSYSDFKVWRSKNQSLRNQSNLIIECKIPTEMGRSLKINSLTLDKKGTTLNNIDFVYNLSSIHLYSRLFGLVPFTLVRDSNGEVQRSRVGKFDLLWFVISISVFSVCLLDSCQQCARCSSIVRIETWWHYAYRSRIDIRSCNFYYRHV